MPQREQLLLLVFIIPALLIAIGDGIRAIFYLFFSILSRTYNVSSTVTKETSIGVTSWLKEKWQIRPLKRKRGRPAKKKNLRFSFHPILQRARSAAQTGERTIFHVYKAMGQTITQTIQTAGTGLRRRIKGIGRAAQAALNRVRTIRFHRPTIKLPTLPTLPFARLKQQSIALTQPMGQPYRPSKLHTTLTDFRGFALGVGAAFLFIFIPYIAYHWLVALPNPQLLTRRDLEVTTKIYDRNGALLYEIYADQNRTPLKLTEIPLTLRQATIAIEDREFYLHPGFSIRGILRAVKETMLHKRLQGGSTITQQLIKSALLSPEVNITRKVKEILLAFWAERMYGKNQILEMYLNQVPYGGTAWGVEAASQTYFGKSVKDINLAESALLAGLPAGPTEYSPFGSHPELALVRQREVIRRMLEERYITKAQANEALHTKLVFAQPHVSIRAPHFVMYVKELLEQRYGTRLVERGGLRIITSLDIGVQEKVEDIVSSTIDGIGYLNVGNGAALVTKPRTGEILAMVGSRNYYDLEHDGNVNVTTSHRQPGSSIKVVTYATALENGFTAASILEDSPAVFSPPGSPPYAPVNYDGKFHGPTPLRYALGNSFNIPPVRLLQKLGLPTMMDKAKLMGIESWEDPSQYGLSLTLGGGEVTMLEMAEVFGTLANAGKRMDLLPILEVTDYTGRIIERNSPKNGVQAVKPETAWIMSNILSDNTARITAFGPTSSLVIPEKTVSVKTGTTDNKRDNWTIGYTPSYVTTVWVGNNNGDPMNPYLASGITGAAPIWHDIMVELLKNKEEEVAPKPDTVVALPCYFGRPEYFVVGTEPPGGRCMPLPTPPPIKPSPTPTSH